MHYNCTGITPEMKILIKNCLCSHSCNFVKTYFSFTIKFNIFYSQSSMANAIFVSIVFVKFQIYSCKAVVGADEGTRTMYRGTSRQRSGKGAIRKRFPLQKPRWEKTKLTIRHLYHETYRSSYFPNRWLLILSYLNLIKI